MKLTKENVILIMYKMLLDLEPWSQEGKNAEKTLAYIEGMRDMATEVIRALEE